MKPIKALFAVVPGLAIAAASFAGAGAANAVPSRTPNGFTGAANMTNSHASTGMTNAMSVNNQNGDNGMFCAVFITTGATPPSSCR